MCLNGLISCLGFHLWRQGYAACFKWPVKATLLVKQMTMIHRDTDDGKEENVIARVLKAVCGVVSDRDLGEAGCPGDIEHGAHGRIGDGVTIAPKKVWYMVLDAK